MENPGNKVPSTDKLSIAQARTHPPPLPNAFFLRRSGSSGTSRRDCSHSHQLFLFSSRRNCSHPHPHHAINTIHATAPIPQHDAMSTHTMAPMSGHCQVPTHAASSVDSHDDDGSLAHTGMPLVSQDRPSQQLSSDRVFDFCPTVLSDA